MQVLEMKQFTKYLIYSGSIESSVNTTEHLAIRLLVHYSYNAPLPK